jgi:outer membrane protein TolC
MKDFSFFLALVMTLSMSVARAQQESYPLSIPEMFRLADENNRRIRAFSTGAEEAAAGVDVSKSAFLPSVEASLSVGYNGNGRIMDRDFTNSFSAPIPHYGNNFSLEVSQVVYAGGAIRNGVKMAELQSDIAVLNAAGNRQEVRLLIVGNYLDLCKMRNRMKVIDSHIVRTQEMLVSMRRRHGEGAALLNDITRYELQLQSLEYSRIELQNAAAVLNSRLASALGLSEQFVIIPDSVEEIHSDEGVEYWQNVAAMQSSHLDLARKHVSLGAYREKNARAERLPRVALFAAEHLDGPVVIDIPAQNKNFNYWSVGVGVKYNIGSLYNSGKKIRESRLALQKAGEDQAVAEAEVRLAVGAAYIHYRETFVLHEVKVKSVELADRNYAVVSYRYENGLALITDLMDATSQKLDAELQAVDARINIAMGLYRLRYVAGAL